MTAFDTAYQLAIEISTLGQAMVRLDGWARAARKREEWTEVGELEQLRLATQLRRSDLLYDAWCARKGQWER